METETRCIIKNFKCDNCTTRFKKLVQYQITRTTCSNCGREGAEVLEENEFNREGSDRTYRIAFDHTDENFERQYHPRTDVLDRDPTNIYGDPQRRVIRQVEAPRRIPSATSRRPEISQTTVRPQPSPIRVSTEQPRPRRINFIQQFFIPYTISPFNGNVRRQAQPTTTDFFSEIFLIPTTEFFSDNFASNFSSNFENPLTRIIFLQSMQNQPTGTPPASKTAISKLKKFNMRDEFCKKNEKGVMECPECSVCMAEIKLKEVTVLIPCGHMYHETCIMKWLDMHNSCPVCRYELPTDDQDYERSKQARQNNHDNANGDTQNVRT